MGIARHQVVSRWDLEHARIKRAHLVAAQFRRVVERFIIPAGRNAGGEKRLHLGGEIDRIAMESIEQGLDAETVAGGKYPPIHAVPEYEGKFTAQPLQAVDAQILIKV